MEILKLYLASEDELANKKITDYFDDEVLDSNFWLYWRTMFAFENSIRARDASLHRRFIHPPLGGLPDFSALRFTRYNQYESMILPLMNYLKAHDVQFHMGTAINDVTFAIAAHENGPYAMCSPMCRWTRPNAPKQKAAHTRATRTARRTRRSPRTW